MDFQIRTTLTVTIFSLGLMAAHPGTGHAQEAAQTEISDDGTPVNLSGLWIIDKKASDDLKQALIPSGDRGKGSGGGMSGGGGGRGGHGRGGGMGGNIGGGAPSGIQERMMRNMKDLEKEISRLEIFQTEHEFNVTDGMEMTRLIFTDGRDNKVWTRQGEAIAKGDWQNNTLKIEIQSAGKKQGQVRHYTLSEDGNKLTVLFKKSMGPSGEPKTLRLVYRRN